MRVLSYGMMDICKAIAEMTAACEDNCAGAAVSSDVDSAKGSKEKHLSSPVSCGCCCPMSY